jgi:hypothetical protein
MRYGQGQDHYGTESRPSHELYSLVRLCVRSRWSFLKLYDSLDCTNFGAESAPLPEGVCGLRRTVVVPPLVVGREWGRTVKDIFQHRRSRNELHTKQKARPRRCEPYLSLTPRSPCLTLIAQAYCRTRLKAS